MPKYHKEVKKENIPVSVRWAKDDMKDIISDYALEEQTKQQLIISYWECAVKMFHSLSIDKYLQADTEELDILLHSNLDDISNDMFTVFRAAVGRYLYALSLVDFSVESGPTFRMFRIYQDEICTLCNLPDNWDESIVADKKDVVHDENGRIIYCWAYMDDNDKARSLYSFISADEQVEEQFSSLISVESEICKEKNEDSKQYLDACKSFYNGILKLQTQCYPNVMMELLHLKDDFGLFQPCLIPSNTNLYGICIIENRDESFSVCQCYDLYMRNKLSGFDQPDDDGNPDDMRVVMDELSFEEAVIFINANFHTEKAVPELLLPSVHDGRINVFSTELGTSDSIRGNLSNLLQTIDKHKDVSKNYTENDIRPVRYFLEKLTV